MRVLCRPRAGNLESVSIKVLASPPLSPVPEAGFARDASPLRPSDSAPMPDSPGGLGSTPSTDFSPHTQPLWGALPAEPGEIMHGLGEGGDRRRSSRVLGEPQEAMNSQPEAWEVVGTLGTTVHADRT